MGCKTGPSRKVFQTIVNKTHKKRTCLELLLVNFEKYPMPSHRQIRKANVNIMWSLKRVFKLYLFKFKRFNYRLILLKTNNKMQVEKRFSRVS